MSSISTLADPTTLSDPTTVDDDTDLPPDLSLTVELSLRADNADNTPFSETIHRSYNLSRAAFHAMETAIANLLIGFGDAALAAETTDTAAPPPAS